jgi:hypothetical protein
MLKTVGQKGILRVTLGVTNFVHDCTQHRCLVERHHCHHLMNVQAFKSLQEHRPCTSVSTQMAQTKRQRANGHDTVIDSSTT